ncbi:hypothetical protein PHLCEN_2v12536 [Hermanssonia centrifuga]|uniref:DUF6535 domain-containing protein n=2 Tax=Hermanssonia centrifuga TaxID=98765 RepID=A0A2R6NHY9_9APHY|nr:hypothetical protein PHLCEN_2v12536 [Hermanssonia centrifuga]
MATMIPGGSNTHKPTTAEEERINMEKAVRKVLSDIANDKNRSNTQGWPEMAKTLRDVDEEKIKDTKEDIDTLLVFAGLFAAVLTPFLAETYQTLSEDPGDTSVAIQRHMSAQMSSYVLINGSLNSTVPAYPADEPSFVPPPFALSINVLWFASLALAVVTASFGILVKQWLREYMTIETSRGAKARLRVRQFRVTALDDWKVYEIAAVLPLLLQFSLGLFFVGLCFFSRSVHPTIGWTITSIVSAWGCLFFFAIFAPACSARCPYKTAVTKKAMRALRRLIYNCHLMPYFYFGPVKKSGFPMEDEDAATDAKGDVQILTAADAILLDDDLLVTTMSESLKGIQSSVAQAEVINFVVAALQQRSPASDPAPRPGNFLNLDRVPERTWTTLYEITAQTCSSSFPGEITDLEVWLQDAVMILSTSHPSRPPHFPEDVVETLTWCMTTAIVPTCRLIRDKQLLITIMSRSMAQIQSNPAEVIDAVVIALQQHLPASTPIIRPVVSLVLDGLPKEIWTELVKISAWILKRGPVLRRGSANGLEEWEKDAITILATFYPSTATFHPEAGGALTSCMIAAPVPTCQHIGSLLLTSDSSRDLLRRKYVGPSQWLSHILESFRGSISQLNIKDIPAKDVLQFIFRLVLAIPRLCDGTCTHDRDQHDLGELLFSHADDVPNSTISSILTEYRNRLSASEREADPQYVNLVAAADAALKDVDFLREALQEALQRSQHSYRMNCIAGVVRNWQRHATPSNRDTSILHFDNIPGDLWTMIMDYVQSFFDADFDADHTDWKGCVESAFIVLMSAPEDFTATEEGLRMLSRCISSLEDRQSKVVRLVLSLNVNPRRMRHEYYASIIERLSCTSPPTHFRLEETTLDAVSFIQSSVCNVACNHGSRLGEMYTAHQDQVPLFLRVAHFLMASATAAKTCLGDTSLSGLDALLIAIFSADASYKTRKQRLHIAISASACAMADIHVLDFTYRHLDARVLTSEETRFWCSSLSRLIGELEHFQTLRIQLEQDNVSFVEVAGKCLDLLGSQPDRSAIDTFLKAVSRSMYEHYELKDLIRALKAFIPEDKVSQYPILDALPEEEHIQNPIPG